MSFLTRFFTPKPKPTPAPAPAPAAQRPSAAPAPTAYAGPIVGLFSSDNWYGGQFNVLFELDSPAAVSAIPGSFVCPSDPVGRIKIHRGRNSETRTEVAPGVKAMTAVSGGRSFRRPQWFADLGLCGAYIFALENIDDGYSHLSARWQLRNWDVPGAPVVFIINTPDQEPGAEPRKPLFDKQPTVAELAATLQLEAGVLEGRAVQIVLCCYNVPKPSTAAQTGDDKGSKGKSKSKTQPDAPPPRPELVHPAEVAAALAWLQPRLVADSWATAMARKHEREAAEAAEKAEREKAQRDEQREAAAAAVLGAGPPAVPQADGTAAALAA